MQGRFTSGALRVIEAAEQEARALSHNSVGSEHLLLGLVRAADGVAAGVLSSLGVSLESTRAQVELMVGRGIQPPGFGQLPLTPRARRALRLAAGHARRFKESGVGAEHLLLGLLRDGGGTAVRVLARLGASPAAVRDRYVQLAGLQGSAARSIRVATGPPGDRFTDGARRAIVRAQDEARRLGHQYIGTEDLLLGLAGAAGEPAAMALESLGVTVDAVRQQAEQAAGQAQQPMPPSGHIPYAAEARRVLELSLREALRCSERVIGTEHLLLALIRDGGSPAVRMLVHLGCDPAAVRDRLVR